MRRRRSNLQQQLQSWTYFLGAIAFLLASGSVIYLISVPISYFLVLMVGIYTGAAITLFLFRYRIFFSIENLSHILRTLLEEVRPTVPKSMKQSPAQQDAASIDFPIEGAIATLHRNPILPESPCYFVRRVDGRDQYLQVCLPGPHIVYCSSHMDAMRFTNYQQALDAANYCWLSSNCEYSFVIQAVSSTAELLVFPSDFTLDE